MVNDNLVYLDWSAGNASPKALTMEDAPMLKDSDKLFARKFSYDVSGEVLDYLDGINV